MRADIMNIIIEKGEAVLNGHLISKDEAEELACADGANLYLLLAIANKIREHFTGNTVDLCSVINGKAGHCSEDCAFCAQSSHYRTNVTCHSLLSEDELVTTAIRLEKNGANHSDIATSGLGFNGNEEDFQKILAAFRRIHKETHLKMCACLGVLNKNAAKQLADVGVERYSINLQASRDFFSKIVTTHSYDTRIDTIKNAKVAGMEVCSGMIIGLGETMAQRIELGLTLRQLDVDAVPINVLAPIPGTPLENANPLTPGEILKTFAIMRFILPDKNLRYAAGRESALRSLEPYGLTGGLNGMLIGDCLTIAGADNTRDRQMLKDLGLGTL